MMTGELSIDLFHIHVFLRVWANTLVPETEAVVQETVRTLEAGEEQLCVSLPASLLTLNPQD